MTVILAVFVGALYWAVEKQFYELEAQMLNPRVKYT
jgi:hypothetical protein